ncbi:MAG: C-terminal binding protein [Actinomycetota bacterium]
MGDLARVAILGTRYADVSVEQRILGPRGVEVTRGDGADADSIVRETEGATVVLAGSRPRFDATVLERLTCRGIVRYGVGVESIDLDAARRHGLWVAYVPDYGTDAVATHAVMLLLALLRRLTAADELVKAGKWGFGELRPLHAPSALTVGIVGFGRIGRRVAQLLAPFGFRLLAHDAYADVSGDANVATATLDELLGSSEAITLHAPGDARGGALLGEAELARMKPGAVLVNTARGSLVEEGALVDALRNGALAGAALDVFQDEPPSAAFARVADRVILTPHMAWYTEESELDLRTKAANEALRIIEGDAPINVAARPNGAM